MWSGGDLWCLGSRRVPLKSVSGVSFSERDRQREAPSSTVLLSERIGRRLGTRNTSTFSADSRR